MRLRFGGMAPRFAIAAGLLLAAAALGGWVGPRGAPAAASATSAHPVAPRPLAADRDRMAPGPASTPAPAPSDAATSVAASAVDAAGRAVPHDAFEVSGSVVPIVGTYRDCSGRQPVGMRGAYYEPCMEVPYWVGHHAVLGAILHANVLTYWDGAGTPHRWRVIGRRVLRAGDVYPGPLPGASAELQTCLEATDTSPVQIVDYSG